MSGKIGVSRRQWAALAGSAALLRGQTPAPAAAPAAPAAPAMPADDLTQARERLRRAAAELRKVKLDASVEPAFKFRA